MLLVWIWVVAITVIGNAGEMARIVEPHVARVGCGRSAFVSAQPSRGRGGIIQNT